MRGNTRANLALVAAAIAALVLPGCRSHDDVNARYSLERMLWKAQIQERKINIAFIRASQRDLALAIEHFNAVAAFDPLAAGVPDGWDPGVVADIRRIQLVSSIALANLYFLGELYNEAGDTYAHALGEPDLGFDKLLDIRLNLARTLYLSGDSDVLEKNCEAIYAEINGNDRFWSGEQQVADVFLSIPLVLTRLYADEEDNARYEAFYEEAEDFYTRIEVTWPDQPIAAKAIYSRVMLRLQRERWREAVADIDRLVVNPDFEERHGEILLLKGEILTNALGDRRAGRAVFEELVRIRPGTPAAYGAAFNIATQKLEDGDRSGGLEMLRELESGDDGVPAEVAARAMLTRAKYLEQDGRWDEAIPLLRRVSRLYPDTAPAVEAPLVITQHYIAIGEPQLAERNLKRATEFYLSLIDRTSKYRGDRLLVEDFLIENYLVMGQAKEVAKLLEDRSDEWDEVSSVGGVLKSAVIYSAVLDDRENAVRVLNRSIELFPGTRYAKIAQQQLELLDQKQR